MIRPLLALLLLSPLCHVQAQGDAAAAGPTPRQGFFLHSPDHRHEVQVEGLLQTHGRFFEPGLSDRVSEFFLRRFRLELAGHLHRHYRFKIEPNFTEDGVGLDEAWIGLQPQGSDLRIMLGRMKEPFGLEESSSLRKLEFVEMSLLGQLVPAEDHGITVHGKALDGAVEWGLAYYNGSGGDDLNSDQDAAGRLVWHPSESFQLGIAATHGRARQEVGGEELRTEARVPFAEFLDGARRDGAMTRLGVESAFFRGPFSSKAEYMHVDQDMNGNRSGTVTLQGFYLACTYLLTGETKSWDSVQPTSPFDPGTGSGSGAWELAARFSQLQLDDDLVHLGLVAPTTHAGRVRSLTSIMSTSGSRKHGLGKLSAYKALVRPRPRSREEAEQAAVEIFRVIGSPGFPQDEAGLRRRAGLAFERATEPTGFHRQLAAIVSSGSRRTALGGVTAPTLVVHGDADPLIPLTAGQGTAQSIPDAELLIIEGMGHDLPEGAQDRIVQAISEVSDRGRSR